MPQSPSRPPVRRTNAGIARLLPTLLAASVAASLAACAAGPDYHTPASDMSAAYPHAAALEARDATQPAPSPDSWWLGFDDPALTRVIQRALEQNLDLAAAIARVDQAPRRCEPRRRRTAAAGVVVWQREQAAPVAGRASGQPRQERAGL